MDSNNSEADWFIARKGISLLLNNKTEEAETLFTQHPYSFHIKAGRSFLLFMNALMTFEDDKLQQAIQLLRNMEKECVSDIGWLKSMKTRVFGTNTTDNDYVRKLERQVVLADSQVYSALLTLLQQQLSGYMRGGWMLRKAWRVYQHTYKQILELYRCTFGNSPSGFHSIYTTLDVNRSKSSQQQSPMSPLLDWSIPSSNASSSTTLSSSLLSQSGLRSSLSMLFSFAEITSKQQTPFVEPSEVRRLMSMVSFAYGIFQLCVSLLPPSLLKLIHFLGFEGDKQVGLMALMYSRLSEDMRAPLATLVLLWYHTIVRPFFALDDSNVIAGVQAAKTLIAECYPEFENSALFLIFTGRIERLQSNVNGALWAYKKAVEMSAQREIKLLCLHEVVWCHLICLNYEDAHNSLTILQEESRWSKSFYAYLTSVCSGAEGDLKNLSITYKKLLFFMDSTIKDTQLDLFISKRVCKLIDQVTGCAYKCKSSHFNEPMDGLSDLIEGLAYSYLKNKEAAIKCYRNCLKQRLPSKGAEDQHISAFALCKLGSILCTGSNVEEGRCILQRAQSQYKDYDFESHLNVRIHTILKKVS